MCIQRPSPMNSKAKMKFLSINWPSKSFGPSSCSGVMDLLVLRDALNKILSEFKFLLPNPVFCDHASGICKQIFGSSSVWIGIGDGWSALMECLIRKISRLCAQFKFYKFLQVLPSKFLEGFIPLHSGNDYSLDHFYHHFHHFIQPVSSSSWRNSKLHFRMPRIGIGFFEITQILSAVLERLTIWRY